MPRPTEQREWYRIAKASATGDGEGTQSSADVYIYDEIGSSWWGGVDAKEFVDEIGALQVDTINLYLNSPGGEAWDGIAIMNALKRHPATVDVTVDGLAASIASVIAMAGDSVTMGLGAQMMVHDAWGVVVGNAQDMQETAVALGKLSDSIASTYAHRAGGTVEDWRATMQAETWYTAEEAVTAGLADKLDVATKPTSAEEPTAAAMASLSRSVARDGLAAHFRFKGRAEAPKPSLTPGNHHPSDALSEDTNRKDEVVANDSNLAAGTLRERFGLKADATDEQLLAKVDEALAKDQTPKIPENTVLLDKGQLEELQSAAAAGVEARAQQTKERRDAIVDAAVREGRIAPVSRAAWREQIDTNEEGVTTLLASLAANTIPVKETGVSDDATSTDEQRLYAMAWPTDNNIVKES